MNKKAELLAPAGDLQSLKAALLAGADAVYLGGKHFGARAFAQNFDEQALLWARRVTRALDRKLYITLNTLVFDHEFAFLDKVLDFYEVLQPDALILQDLGVIAHLRDRKSQIPRHLSTQGAWEGFGGKDLLQELGITRVILPRETSRERIRHLVRTSGFDIEVFVHGAMCFSISGRCFWSAALGERSGNRGTCAQPCRKCYKMEGNEFTFPFSPKDLRLADSVPDLLGAGVTSLKIEGRMKGPEYVFKVVQVYRALIDKRSATQNIHGELNSVFSRPHHQGFLNGLPGTEWHTPETSGRQGTLIGTVASLKRRDGLTELCVRMPVNAGDGLAWTIDNEKDGARITWAEQVQGKKDHVLVRGMPDVPLETPIFLTDAQESKEWLKGWNKDWERMPVDLFWSGHEGSPLAVETVLNGRAVRVESEEALVRAKSTGLETGPLQEKFSALGETFRTKRQVIKALETGLFLSPTALKKLKRELTEVLQGLLKSKPPIQPDLQKKPVPVPINIGRPQPKLAIRLWATHPLLPQILKPDCWILPFRPNQPYPEFPPEKTRFWLSPPAAEADLEATIKTLEKLPEQEFLCFGWEAFTLAGRLPQHRFRCDWMFNLANSAAVKLIQSKNLSGTAAREWPVEDQPPERSNMVWSVAHNPLISLSRFPPIGKINQLFANSHGDQFFQLELGPGLFGLFLKNPLSPSLSGIDLPLQIDLAFAPGENLIRTAKELNTQLTRHKH